MPFVWPTRNECPEAFRCRGLCNFQNCPDRSTSARETIYSLERRTRAFVACQVHQDSPASRVFVLELGAIVHDTIDDNP